MRSRQRLGLTSNSNLIDAEIFDKIRFVIKSESYQTLDPPGLVWRRLVHSIGVANGILEAVDRLIPVGGSLRGEFRLCCWVLGDVR